MPSYTRSIWLLAMAAVLALSGTLGAQGVPAAGAGSLTPNGQSSAALASNLPGPDADSIISPDDVLDINVMDVPELSRQYRVSPNGKVVLPLLPQPLMAADMKVTDFSDLLAMQLREAGLVTNPHIVVSITSSRMKSVAITGAVKMPQIYPVFGRTTLLDILSQCQGLSDDASNSAVITRGEIGMKAAAGSSQLSVVSYQSQKKAGPAAGDGGATLKTADSTQQSAVSQQNGNQQSAAGDSQPAFPPERTITVDLKKLMESGDPAYNVDIYPGDRVTVPRAGVVYVVGAVNKPGGFPVRSAGDGMTVLQAVAMAEDIKSTAQRSKAMVIRVDPNSAGGHKQVPLDLKKILAGKAEDPVLQANDILFVPDSQGAKALRHGAESAIAIVSGMAMYGRF